MTQQEPYTYTTQISRYYIDTRPLTPFNAKAKHDLPLLATLTQDQQDSITRYMRPADRLMSLASALLKNTFIHRTAKIPWPQIQISRTPDPHKRPYWDPPSTYKGGLEFNVTHQAGMVALMGCRTPTSQVPTGADLTPANQVQIGIDVSCSNEDRRTPQDITTQAALDKWIDVFSAMFSDAEREEMKIAPLLSPTHRAQTTRDQASVSLEDTVKAKLRRFYAYWAFKEAYIKMVGEGLLAEWLKELEFGNVVVPDPVRVSGWDRYAGFGMESSTEEEERKKWTPPEKSERGANVSLRGERISDVSLEIVAYEEDFIVASAIKGVRDSESDDGDGGGGRWVGLDIEKDIRPCAEGTCRCLHVT